MALSIKMENSSTFFLTLSCPYKYATAVDFIKIRFLSTMEIVLKVIYFYDLNVKLPAQYFK